MLLLVFAIFFILLFTFSLVFEYEEFSCVCLVLAGVCLFILFIGSVVTNGATVGKYKRIVDCYANTNTNLLNEYMEEKNKLDNIYETEKIKHFKIVANDPEIYTKEQEIEAKKELTKIKNDKYFWFFRGDTIEDKYLLKEN